MKPRCHDENRKLVCAACGIKNLKCFTVTEQIEQTIKEVYKEYSRDVSSYPVGVCPTCRNHLKVVKKTGLKSVSKERRKIWSIDYSQFQAPQENRRATARFALLLNILV